MESQMITLPIEVSELATKIASTKKEEVQIILQQIFNGTDNWERQVEEIEVKSIDDKMSIGLAETARKNVKQARLNAEKIFDAKREEVQNLKVEFDLEDKLWLKAKQVMQLKFKAIEEKAEWKATFVKRFEAEQKELRTQKRINDVSKFATINRVEFEEMSDEIFNSFINGLEHAYNEKIELAKKEEEERIAKEKVEKEARELQISENKRLKEEAEKREKEIELERKATEAKLAKEKEIRNARSKELQPYIFFIKNFELIINKPDAEYKNELIGIKKDAEAYWENEEKARIQKQKIADEKEAILKAERERNAKLEAELKAKKELEAKLELEQKQAELKAKKESEKLAKEPVKKQLMSWVETFELPPFATETETAKAIFDKFESFKRWSIGEIDKI